MRRGAKKNKILLILPPIPFLNAAPSVRHLPVPPPTQQESPEKETTEKLKFLFLGVY